MHVALARAYSRTLCFKPRFLCFRRREISLFIRFPTRRTKKIIFPAQSGFFFFYSFSYRSRDRKAKKRRLENSVRAWGGVTGQKRHQTLSFFFFVIQFVCESCTLAHCDTRPRPDTACKVVLIACIMSSSPAQGGLLRREHKNI